MNRNDRVDSAANGGKRKGFSQTYEAPHAEYIPPPPDEAYWAALLYEGEDGEAGFSEAPDGERPTVGMSPDSAEEDWIAAEKIYEADGTVELTVNGANRGGLLVEWNSLRGFVPASQLIDFPATADPRIRKGQLALYIGQLLRLRIIEFDKPNNRLIFSERAAQVQAGTRATVFDRLRRGDTVSGQVTNVCDFGAFVDLGGLEGLIHISEMSWGRVNHPRDLLNRGDTVRVYVMDVNRDQGRIALSLKRMQPDPWATVAERYQVGQVISGQVTNIVDFGAFVSIENGLEGLIHVSELAEGHFLHPRNVIHEGEQVRARILNIDSQGRRLGLSLRASMDGES